MALDPATELRELDAILASPDDPDTKRQRIALLYDEPAANDPRGLPAEATAQLGGGGMGGAPNMTGAAPGNVPDVPVEVPGAGGAGGAPGAGGSGGTLGSADPALIAQSGASGPGNLPAAAPAPAPMAASQGVAPAPRPGPTTLPETTVRAAPRKPGPADDGIPDWLQKEMGPAETYFGRDPLAKPVTQAENAAYRDLESAQLEGTREQAEAEAQAIQAGARAELAAVERGQLVDAELARRELERQNNLAALERGYAEMLAEAQAEPIDSERLWNNKSTGEKVLSKIALFIGTIGAGAATGNPMLIANKLDADIERDIQAQKANQAFKLHALAAKGTLYGMARERFQSEHAVDAAMRETAWRKIGAELNAFQARAQDPARKAAIQRLVDATESRILDAERQRRLLNETDTVKRLQAQMAGRAAGKPPPRNEAKDLIEGLSTQDGIIKKLERLKSLTGPAGNRVWGSDTRGEAETLRKKLQLDYKRGEQTGTLDKGSLDFFDSMIGTPEEFFRNPASEAKLDQLITDARAKQTQLRNDFGTLQSIKTGPASRGTGGKN